MSLEIYCYKCEKELETYINQTKGHLEIEPCEHCLEDAREEGRVEEREASPE